MRLTSFLAVSGGMTAAAVLVSTVQSAVGVDSTNLRNAVTLGGVRAHQAALQAIATAEGGTRASGTPGYAESVAYVESQLSTAYYNVSVVPFDFPFFQEISPSFFERTAPTAEVYVNGVDFLTMEYSGPGDVQAPLQNAGGIVLPPTPEPSSASGCTDADFADFDIGNIALIQRGTCTFAEKVANAEEAGAIAVVIFNEGQPGRTEAFAGTLGGPFAIPVLSASFEVGEELATTPGAVVHIITDTFSEPRTTWNVIADTKNGRRDRVVVVGAHLDSVLEGPGINDNGSGTASILEIAQEMAELGIRPRNQVRFMWFGAEESGLLGSEHYVSTLTKRQRKDIAVNLNFDMVGSPNFVRFVYDGDGSATPQPGPNGSGVVEDVFLKYFASQGLPTEPTAFDGRSDYGPFIAVGIPAGGLFTGAEGIKTPEQAATYGGTAGDAYDPCYHEACDTFANNSDTALDQMADASAHATLQFAMTTSAVQGTGKGRDRTVASVAARKLLYKGGHLKK
jgi:Zn-dependent M28 family amino/carboxypeptidase